jgi:hypothetical protein
MKKFFLLCAVFFIGTTTGYAADGLVWRSTTPSAQTLWGFDMIPGSSCYATVHRLQGQLYYHPSECDAKVKNHIDWGFPIGKPIVRAPREARSISIRKDGMIILK